VKILGSLWQLGTDLLLGVLNFFYSISHSYGVAIILLTILIRVLLYPLSHKQLVSMKKMQQIQPRIITLQEKYKDDKQKLNQEIMKLYREYGVNPAAGCLPLLVQLPILILLFRVIMNYDFGGEFFLGISLEHSLLALLGQALGSTAPKVGITTVINAISSNPAGLLNFSVYGGTLILWLGIGFVMWFQQRITAGAAATEQAAFMGWFMPLFMMFICLNLPGGVMLYWGVSSLIGVVQQVWVQRKTSDEATKKPALYKEKPRSAEKSKDI
jgi:YidC/Oxa1 family membrane protein insertase